MGNQEQLDHLDPLEREDCLACLAFLDPKDTEASQVWMGPKEKWVPQV